MIASRTETVRVQLDRTNVEWAHAARELREVLIGLAEDVDILRGRVERLEAEGPPGCGGGRAT